MDDLARLQIRVQSLEADVAGERLDGLARKGAKAEKATDRLTETFKRFVGPAALAAGAVAAMTKVVSAGRSFEVLNAQLITATGSASNAATPFEAIQGFATSTPYLLVQVTESFTKLVNLGLNPSEAALNSYGNTASAMGKDLNQLIEAVADAATGEFERLKEFGIKTKSEGDNVSFTFRGVTTTVGKNAAEIEGYLQALGNNEFAGAMQQRVETLDGAISNLGDEWNKTFTIVSNAGVGEVVEDSVRMAIDVLAELNAMLASGEMEAKLVAIGSKFDGFGRDVAGALDAIGQLWNDFIGSEGGDGIVGGTKNAIDFVVLAFKNLPENIRAVIQLMAVEIGALVDYGKEYGQAFGEVIASEFDKIVDKSKAYGTAIGKAVNPFDDEEFNLEARLREIDGTASDMADKAFSRAEKRAEITAQSRRDSINAILAERDEALTSFDAQIRSADELRTKYDEAAAARKKAGGDRLAAFGLGSTDEPGESDADAKLREAREKKLEDLRKSLRTEEEVIQESYNSRLAIILENTVDSSTQQADLKRRLDEEFATSALGDLATPDSFEEELNQLQEFYDARKELILNNTSITEQERTALEEELTKQRNERIAALDRERLASTFGASSDLFGSLADLSKEFAGEQSDTFKAMFAASKAFAIAESTIKIAQGIANAASLPFPANLGAMATVAASTVGLINTITSTQLSSAGTFDNGGTIPHGKVGLVGEFGPELVAGPANVRSRRETAEMFKEGKDSGSSPAPNLQNNIRIINNVDPSVFQDFLGSAAGEELIMNTIRNNPESVRAVATS